MTEVINLGKQRKAKARTQKEKAAQQNRLLHGQTKAQKQLKKKQSELAAKKLAGHKRDDSEE